MAIKKTIELPSGVSAEYFKISQIHMVQTHDRLYPLLTIRVEVYRDSDARLDAKKPVEERGFTFQFESSLDYEDYPIFQVAYKLMKELDEFADAEDC